MDTKKRNLLIGAIGAGVALVLFIVIAIFGMFRGFNAEKYVSAILNQTFKGEVETVAHMTKGSNPDELYAQYEAGITSFAKNSIAGGVEMEPELEEKYVSLCKKIFADMKYSVIDHKKISDDTYEVTVEFQASDIITRFEVSMATVTKTLNERTENGEYRGTKEEINAQMKKDFLKEVYPLYETDYKEMEYGEKETVVFKVEKGESGLYKLNGEEITEFIAKILGADEKQD